MKDKRLPRKGRPPRKPRPSRSPRDKRDPEAEPAPSPIAVAREDAPKKKRKWSNLDFGGTAATTCLLAAALVLGGCTSLRVKQTDESPDARKIISDVRATAWFSSAQVLTKLKTLQSDKSQSTGFGSLDQHGATNIVESLNAIVKIIEALRPTP